MANRPIKPNGLSLTRVLIFAARGAAVKHFYVCARDVAKSPPRNPLPRKLFIPRRERASSLYANPAYEYYSGEPRGSAPLSASYRVLNSVAKLHRSFYRRPTLRARKKKRKKKEERKKSETEKANSKMNSRRVNERRYSPSLELSAK